MGTRAGLPLGTGLSPHICFGSSVNYYDVFLTITLAPQSKQETTHTLLVSFRLWINTFAWYFIAGPWATSLASVQGLEPQTATLALAWMCPFPLLPCRGNLLPGVLTASSGFC